MTRVPLNESLYPSIFSGCLKGLTWVGTDTEELKQHSQYLNLAGSFSGYRSAGGHSEGKHSIPAVGVYPGDSPGAGYTGRK